MRIEEHTTFTAVGKLVLRDEDLTPSLVHICFDQQAGERMPSKCVCDECIPRSIAVEVVCQGLADWLVDYSGEEPVRTWDIVALRAKKTPRVQTVEKAHIERAYVDKSVADIERIEEWGALDKLRFSVTALVSDDAGDFGRPILNSWAVETTKTHGTVCTALRDVIPAPVALRVGAFQRKTRARTNPDLPVDREIWLDTLAPFLRDAVQREWGAQGVCERDPARYADLYVDFEEDLARGKTRLTWNRFAQ